MRNRNIVLLSEGRNRRVWRISERYVLKEPLNENGVFDNDRESR